MATLQTNAPCQRWVILIHSGRIAIRKTRPDRHDDRFDSDDESDCRKAAWEIGCLPAEHAAPVLTEHLPTYDLELREILESGLYRAPSKEAVGVIGENLKKEAEEHPRLYKLDHHRLKTRRAWLENNASTLVICSRR